MLDEGPTLKNGSIASKEIGDVLHFSSSPPHPAGESGGHKARPYEKFENHELRRMMHTITNMKGMKNVMQGGRSTLLPKSTD